MNSRTELTELAQLGELFDLLALAVEFDSFTDIYKAQP
jgi:hypothetical protein